MNKENAHLYLPLVKALAEGKTIQFEINDGKSDWEDVPDPQFNWATPDRYRVKPEFLTREELLKLCGGKEPHRVDGWREEWLPPGTRPLLKGEVKESCDECDYYGSWNRVKCPGQVVDSHGKRGRCRTRRPLPVEPKLVPLGPEDVPPGSALMFANEGLWRMVHGTSSEGLYFSSRDEVHYKTFIELSDGNWKILRPGQSDWQPCSKEAK